MNLWSHRIKTIARNYLADESGQSTTEYVLLLLFVVLAVKAAGNTLRTKIQDILNAAFNVTQNEISNANGGP